MPYYSEINQYPGVNAHLNSFLQQEGSGWEMFHAEYVIAIARTLDMILPRNYYAVSEKSLQIVENRFDFSFQHRQHRTRPDVTVYQLKKSTTPVLAAANSETTAVAAPTRTIALAEMLDDEPDESMAVVIYEVDPLKVPGQVVTRIELLSPANKPPQLYHRHYMAKRMMLLNSGINLIELDFLHQTEPITPLIPSYPKREDDSYPYTIIVTNPHPRYCEGRIDVYGVAVDDKLPTIAIPLSGDETIALNFGAVYNQVFQSVRVLSMPVDYEREPENFMSYSDKDRQRIRALMNKIVTDLP